MSTSAGVEVSPLRPSAPVPQTLLGIPFHPVNRTELFQIVEAWIHGKSPGQISVLNAYSVTQTKRNAVFRQAVFESQLVVSDGRPLVWLSRILGKPLPEQMAGPDLFEEMCRLASAKGYRVFFLGSTPQVLECLTRALQGLLPTLQIAGSFSPPMQDWFSQNESDLMVDLINRAQTDILWVGMTAPKQEIWIHRNLPALRCGVAMGVGAAFEFLAGTKKRAPFWMRRCGLEWCHRLLSEPRRMWKRYLLGNFRFLHLVFMEICKNFGEKFSRIPRK